MSKQNITERNLLMKEIETLERRILCATTTMKLDTSQGFTRNLERNKTTLQRKETRTMLITLSYMQILLQEGMTTMKRYLVTKSFKTLKTHLLF